MTNSNDPVPVGRLHLIDSAAFWSFIVTSLFSLLAIFGVQYPWIGPLSTWVNGVIAGLALLGVIRGVAINGRPSMSLKVLKNARRYVRVLFFCLLPAAFCLLAGCQSNYAIPDQVAIGADAAVKATAGLRQLGTFDAGDGKKISDAAKVADAALRNLKTALDTGNAPDAAAYTNAAVAALTQLQSELSGMQQAKKLTLHPLPAKAGGVKKLGPADVAIALQLIALAEALAPEIGKLIGTLQSGNVTADQFAGDLAMLENDLAVLDALDAPTP